MSRVDTIVALSSGGLPAGVAVIRVSGSQVRMLVRTLAGNFPEAREATYRQFRSKDGSILDSGLVIFFPAPASFTGEDCAEFQVHGGRAVVSAMLREICSFEACRLAEAGEFMRRAFLNGKTDLLGAEATADLISAETEAQRRLAVENARGSHAALYAKWRSWIIQSRAMVEASLDFSDEGDIEGEVAQAAQPIILELLEEIEAHLGGFRSAEIIRNGLDVVIVGAPNSGKSSLLNALAKRDVAIVSDEPGTTRDLIEVALDLDGHKLRLTDSAGLRETTSKVEAIGIGRAIKRAREADLVLHLKDGTAEFDQPELDDAAAEVWLLESKADLRDTVGATGMVISSTTGQGLAGLLERLGDKAKEASERGVELLPWRRRHVDLLGAALRDLTLAVDPRLGAEVAAEHLRLASEAIGRISGAVDVEDLLDVIFSQFCIGK